MGARPVPEKSTRGEARTEALRARVAALELEVERAALTREALAESEARYRSLFHDSRQVMLLLDGASGRIRDANPAACRYYGLTWPELTGRSASELDARGIDAPLGRMAREGGQFSARHRLADGSTREVEVLCSPIHLQGRAMVYAIVHDITEKKALEAEAAMAARLASIGELAAGVAHEINNPINGVINLAQLIIDRPTSPQATGDYPRLIIDEGRRVSEIVHSLLAFARPHSSEPEPTAVGAVLDAAMALLGGRFGKRGLGLELDLPQGLPPVLARGRQIQQVFMNLLSNALHALEDLPPGGRGGVLRIQARPGQGADGGTVRVSFIDNGPGLDEERAARVFEPFFSTKASGRGTGLGLSVSHRIVADHGGRMGFESRPGAGSTVWVELPAATEAP